MRRWAISDGTAHIKARTYARTHVKRARTHRRAPSFARKEILKTTAQLKIACFTQMIARLFIKFMRKSALKY